MKQRFAMPVSPSPNSLPKGERDYAKDARPTEGNA